MVGKKGDADMDETSVDLFGEESNSSSRNELKAMEEVVKSGEISEEALQEEMLAAQKSEERQKEEQVKNSKAQAKMSETVKMNKLMKLLGKCKLYCSMLVKKMDEEESLERIKNEWTESRKKILEGNTAEPEKASKRGGRGTKRKAEEKEDASKRPKIEQRFFNGEPISEKQPLLLVGGIMRQYQLKGKGVSFWIS